MIHMSFVINLHIVFVLMALFGQLVSQLLGNFAYQWGRGKPIQTERSARFREGFSRPQNLSIVAFAYSTGTGGQVGGVSRVRTRRKKKKLSTGFS